MVLFLRFRSMGFPKASAAMVVLAAVMAASTGRLAALEVRASPPFMRSC
jgi:hypothetical protein